MVQSPASPPFLELSLLIQKEDSCMHPVYFVKKFSISCSFKEFWYLIQIKLQSRVTCYICLLLAIKATNISNFCRLSTVLQRTSIFSYVR